MDSYRFLAKLFGVRGSYPIAPPQGTRIGGNTTCLLTRTPEHIVIFDAGSGIINLGKELVPEILEHSKNNDSPFNITILFTHTHLDHLIGLPFFAPIYFPQVHLHLIGPASLGMPFEDIIRTQFLPQYFPVGMDELRSRKTFYNLTENTFVYFNPNDPLPQIERVNEAEPAFSTLKIYTMKYYFHPKDGSYPFRIEWNENKIVLATDVEQYVGGDQRLINFSKEANVLIHDAQYSEEQYKKFSGYGHSSIAMACDAAKQAQVKELLLFHHDPNNSDDYLREMEKEAQSMFTESKLATETWSLKL
ncbi:MAG: MBL fold metallo-hydrolase [Caldithrix sp.]|nr:MBL fold metallo-hydrolase [Caldithrix sp.]